TSKVINKSQEAKVTIHAPQEVIDSANAFDPAVLEELFIVSAVEFEPAPEDAEVSADISVAEGEKCPRCWNVRALGGNHDHPEVCRRCGDVLDVLAKA
ncbi:MAG: isoleucine--tRNA ligase, partial [Eggerthellaceae bacterium]|nr:isoleucine--tRNA ligase [Eggerthellaceae bacterium]